MRVIFLEKNGKKLQDEEYWEKSKNLNEQKQEIIGIYHNLLTPNWLSLQKKEKTTMPVAVDPNRI